MYHDPDNYSIGTDAQRLCCLMYGSCPCNRCNPALYFKVFCNESGSIFNILFFSRCHHIDFSLVAELIIAMAFMQYHRAIGHQSAVWCMSKHNLLFCFSLKDVTGTKLPLIFIEKQRVLSRNYTES